jgi:NAD(P)-dependent dehydrogenase (short-subunit alcohol dehydrogenase family)
MAKTAIVTGATSGIGLCTARLLVGKGYAVIGVGRSEERCAAAAEGIAAATGAKPAYVVGDLSTTGGCREIARAATAILKAHGGRLDLLLHVAGTVSSWHASTAEGYELQFAVNHLAPFLLTHLLLPSLMKAEEGRVLVVSSESHRHARIRWEDPMMRTRYGILAAYKQSKLCNVLFVAELARRLPPGSRILSHAIDPGLANTDIGLKGTHGLDRLVWKLRQLGGTDPEVPARHMVNVATDPAAARASGLYWKAGKAKRPDRRAQDPAAARRLWELSERLCGIEGQYFPA